MSEKDKRYTVSHSVGALVNEVKFKDTYNIKRLPKYLAD